jgi:hypothetical protein
MLIDFYLPCRIEPISFSAYPFCQGERGDEAENQVIEEIQDLASGGPDESRAGRRRRSAVCSVCGGACNVIGHADRA